MKLEFSQQIFKKFSNIEIHKNASCGNRVAPRGRTDMKLNLLAPELLFLILAHPVYKM